MKIYDISQEVFSCAVYPGDTSPSYAAVQRIESGSLYNLSDVNMSAHNGTHIDAPYHFISDGKTVDAIPLEKTVGRCIVAEHRGRMTAGDVKRIVGSTDDREAAKRVLIKGDAVVTADAARGFVESGVCLVGIESQSFGEIDAPMEAHKILLAEEIVLLEGIRLSSVEAGSYILSAAPLKLGGLDGAPVRALLIDLNDLETK